jgi:hypothetical protein
MISATSACEMLYFSSLYKSEIVRDDSIRLSYTRTCTEARHESREGGQVEEYRLQALGSVLLMGLEQEVEE